MLAPWKQSCDQPRQHIKKQRHYFADKDPSSQSYSFPSSHAWLWELDHEESWTLKTWCFWTVVLEKTLENPLDCKKINQVNCKGHQSWVYFGRTDAEAETPVLWPPDVKNWLIVKNHDAGKDWKQDEKGMAEDEMVRWHLWLDGHEFEQALEFGDGQGGLACCNPWGHKESDMAEQLNWTELTYRDRMSKCRWGNCPDGLVQCWVGINLQFVKSIISVKCNKAKCSKMRSACIFEPQLI